MEAADAAAAGGQLEVVVFPWLAFGHMLPFLQLSKRLAARGHAVAFVSTPRNLARLPPVPPHLSARLRFVSLPLPLVGGLPDGVKSTADVPPEKIDLLKQAMDGLSPPLAAFLRDCGTKPDWIILDFCHHWLPPIATEHNIACALFHIVPAGMNAFVGPRRANADHPRAAAEDFTVPPAWMPFPSTTAYRRHEAWWMAAVFGGNASGTMLSDIERFWRTEERCRLFLNRSCHGVEEPRMFDLLTELFRKPAVPVGLLLPDVADDDGVRSDVLQWLDKQPPKSVIYVALGSEAPLTRENLHELALGLELAGVRFLWALRTRQACSTPAAMGARPVCCPTGSRSGRGSAVWWGAASGGAGARRDGGVPDALWVALHAGEHRVRDPAGNAPVCRRPAAHRASHGGEGDRLGGGEGRERRLVHQIRRRRGGAVRHGGRRREVACQERHEAARCRCGPGAAGAVRRRARGLPETLQRCMDEPAAGGRRGWPRRPRRRDWSDPEPLETRLAAAEASK